jgi:hypothetical protein
MTTKDAFSTPNVDKTGVLSTTALSCGDLIEAAYKGTVVHRGRVADIAPSQELFWITDYLTGSRRLLDVAEFEITRLSNPAPPAAKCADS